MDKGGTAAFGIRLPAGGGGVGGIGSDFATNLNTGVGTYAIPFTLPTGHRGQAPQLALQYSSGMGADAFGLGWSLGTLTIQRDARNGVPTYDDSDALLLAGETLVDVGDGVLRPRVDPSMQRVRRAGAGWEVTDRMGTRFLLGLTEQAQERHPDRSGEHAILAWHLERVEDTSGNVTSYRYLRDGERLYPYRIEYAVYRLEIEYAGRPDTRTVRRGGFAQRTALRATRLALHRPALNPTLLRAYDLTYVQDPMAGHSLLASVTLTGFIDGESEQAPALRFEYAPFDPTRREVRTLTSPGHDGPPGLAGSTVDIVDLEGFGLPGVLEASAASHRYWANRGDGTWAPPTRLRQFPEGVSLADRRVVLADVTGDARADLVVSERARTGWYPGEPGRAWGGKVFAHGGPAVDVRDNHVRLFDANGDGLADLVQATGRAMLLFENGRGWSAPPRVTPRRRDDPTYPDITFDDPRVRLADMSGDGLPDVVRVWARHLEIWHGTGTMRWDPRAVVLLPGRGPERYDPRRCHLADVNGDGLTDVVYIDVDAVYVWINRGESMSEAIRLAYPPPPALETVRVADMLGTTTAGVLFGVSTRPGVRDSYRFLDLTGGTKPYLLTRVDNGVGKRTSIRYGSSAAHRVRDRDAGADWSTFLPRAVQVIDLIEHEDTVTGATASIEYRYHDGHYDARTQRFAGFARVEVIERYGEGTAPVLTRSHFHVGLGSETGQPVSRAAALRGQLFRRETLSPDGSALADRPYLVESTEWQVRVAANARDGTEVLCALPRSRQVQRWERMDAPAVTTTELDHDEFGNVVRERRSGQDPSGTTDPAQDVEITGEYVNDTDRWLLGLLSRRAVRSLGPGAPAVPLEDVRMSYDGLPHGQVGAGLLSRRERLAFTQAQLDEVFVGVPLPDLAGLGYRVEAGTGGTQWWFDDYRADHDDRGNLIACLDADGQETRVEYDSDGLQPVRTTNPIGHVCTAEYHPRLDAITEYVDANGARSRFRYSPLGRVLAELHPGDPDDEPSVRFEYHAPGDPVAGSPLSTVMLRRREGTEPRRSVTYYDGQGNETQTRARQDDGSYLVAARAVMDLRGLSVRSYPAFVSASESFDPAEGLTTAHGTARPGHRVRFDALRRAEQVVDPADRVARATFEPTRIVFRDTHDTDPQSPFANTPRRQEVDAWGRLIAVEEETGTGTVTTRYAYDARGLLSGVIDASGPLLIQKHDGAGRLLWVAHRDAGERRFLRDARGRLVLYVDAAGRRVSWTFDAIGRTDIVALDGVVVERFTYDVGDGEHLVGRLAHADDELGRQTFSYDAKGRLIQTTRTVVGHAEPFAYEYDHDVDNRPTRVRHPDGAQTTYSYDALGRLASVSGLIDSVSYDEQGRRSAVRHAGGEVATHGYDPLLGRLTDYTIVDADGQELLNQHIEYDSVGNVLRVDDANAPCEYAYDALNRIVRAQGGPAAGRYDHRFAYDPIGNLVRNDTWRPEDVTYAGARLVSAGTDIFGYDANGCLVSRPGMVLEYDARELLRRVTRDDGTVVEFGYDHRSRRLRKRVVDATGSQDTLYIGESFEVRPDGSTLRFVTDPDGGATLVITNGVALRTLFHDRLGNVVAVRNAATGALTRVHYTPFGVLSAVGGGAAGGGDDGPDIGEVLFAGRRYDAETGLYYVRMRYYDPLLGRFVSPDPLAVVDAGSARVRPLALNPYVYALDNPLRFTDPTGLWTFWEGFLTVVIAAAIVVAAVATFGVGAAIALAVGAAVGAIIGAATTGSVDGALAGAMLGFSIVATVLAGVWLGGLIGGVFAIGPAGLGLGAFVGVTAASIQAMAFIPSVRQDDSYKDVLGYASWFNPWAWPGHILGAAVFIINGIAYGAAYVFSGGDPAEKWEMSVDFDNGMVVTTGGWIRPGRAFTIGNFITVNPNDPGIADPATREVILRHERGHALNNAHFGIFQAAVAGIGSDQPGSFWEQLAESNVNPYDPSLTGSNKDARRLAGGRGFGSIPWWEE